MDVLWKANNINKLHERALRIVYNDTITTSYEELLIKDKIFTIHQQNIQSLANEMYKSVKILLETNLGKFFENQN